MHYVTQSEIKKMLAYEAGACGLQIEHELSVDGESTPWMKLGIYFEYLVTGALPRNKVVPEPDRTLKNELTAPYKVVVSQAERVKTYLKRMGIAYEAGIWRFNSEHMIGGHIDMIGTSKAMGEFVLDLKYSGLMDNKWEKMGWQWSDHQRSYHAIQAAHYHLITGLPFYYLVTESREKGDVRVFKMEFSEQILQDHIQLVERTRDFLQEMKIGLNPQPEITQCEVCAIYEKCNHRAIYPEVKFVTI